MHRLSLVVVSRGYSSLWCAGFSLRWLLLLRSTGSSCAGFSSCGSRALERRLSSCGARAQLLRGMWDLPGPGLEPVSPALAGFLTTAPPGKSRDSVLKKEIHRNLLKTHQGLLIKILLLRLSFAKPDTSYSLGCLRLIH